MRDSSTVSLSRPPATAKPLADLRSLLLEAAELKRRADALLSCVQMNCIVMAQDSELSNIARIQFLVAAEFHQEVWIMQSPARTEEVAWPRMIAMYFARTMTSVKLQAIGAEFGGRDHGTVLHAVSAVVNRCATNPFTKEVVDDLRKKIAAVLNSKEQIRVQKNKTS